MKLPAALRGVHQWRKSGAFHPSPELPFVITNRYPNDDVIVLLEELYRDPKTGKVKTRIRQRVEIPLGHRMVLNKPLPPQYHIAWQITDRRTGEMRLQWSGWKKFWADHKTKVPAFTLMPEDYYAWVIEGKPVPPLKATFDEEQVRRIIEERMRREEEERKRKLKKTAAGYRKAGRAAAVAGKRKKKGRRKIAKKSKR